MAHPGFLFLAACRAYTLRCTLNQPRMVFVKFDRFAPIGASWPSKLVLEERYESTRALLSNRCSRSVLSLERNILPQLHLLSQPARLSAGNIGISRCTLPSSKGPWSFLS